MTLGDSKLLYTAMKYPSTYRIVRIGCLVALSLSFTAVHAQAKLGETLEQCKVRFGPEISNDKMDKEGVGPMVVFNEKGYKVWIIFYRGVVGYERFRKLDSESDLTYKEALAILSDESPVDSWGSGMSNTGYGLVRKSDGAFAQYYFPSQREDFGPPHQFTIVSLDYAKAVNPKADVRLLPDNKD